MKKKRKKELREEHFLGGGISATFSQLTCSWISFSSSKNAVVAVFYDFVLDSGHSEKVLVRYNYPISNFYECISTVCSNMKCILYEANMLERDFDRWCTHISTDLCESLVSYL